MAVGNRLSSRPEIRNSLAERRIRNECYKVHSGFCGGVISGVNEVSSGYVGIGELMTISVSRVAWQALRSYRLDV